MLSKAQPPKVSIVTPSYNQAPYLEEAICSVLDQKYPNLDYIVIDGGSTDGSVAIIQRYAKYLTYWISEPDGGHMNAINKGFSISQGSIMGWLNSDDVYLPWSLQVVAQIFSDVPDMNWLTSSTALACNAETVVTTAIHLPGFAKTWSYRGWHLGNQDGFKGHVQQESTFWRRTLWEAVGQQVKDRLHFGGDFELWLRFWEFAELFTTTVPLAMFRYHAGQKTSQLSKYYSECEAILNSHRRKSIQHPVSIWWLTQLLKYTGRGGQRFGSRLNWVDYDPQRAIWHRRSKYCI